MSANDPAPHQAALVRRRVRGFRLAGSAVLLLGLGAAGLIYWLGTRSGNSVDDPSLDLNSKVQVRQLEVISGNGGLLIQELNDALKQPGTQALLISIITLLIAAGCFYVAHLSQYDDGGE